MQRVLASVLLLIFLPALIIILVLSLFTQGKPLFFIQKRVGRGRKLFKIFKLRTMKDGLVTPFGKFLRNFGLDESPQLINIIMGDMAFIGPRPLTSSDIKRLEWDNKTYDIRWSVKPGITGLSQLSNSCSKENTWKLDSEYCKTHSLRVDFNIILLTLLKVIKGKTEVR